MIPGRTRSRIALTCKTARSRWGGAKSTLASVIRRMFAWAHEERIIRTNPALELCLRTAAGSVSCAAWAWLARSSKVTIAELGSMIVVLVIDDRVLGQGQQRDNASSLAQTERDVPRY